MTSPHYDLHIFVCQNVRPASSARPCCASQGAAKLLEYMKTSIKKNDIKNIRINKSGCLNECERGIATVIYPEGTWYSIKTTEDIDKVIELHISCKKKVVNLLMV